MSKPLYMQLSDMQNAYNRQVTRNGYQREELAALLARAEAAEARVTELKQSLREFADRADEWAALAEQYKARVAELEAALQNRQP